MRTSGRGFLLIFGLILVGLLDGCTLTPPASESLVFQKQENNSPSGLFFHDHSESSTEFSIPASGPNTAYQFTFRPAIKGEMDYARDKFSSFINRKFSQDSTLSDDNLKVLNSNYLSFAISPKLFSNDVVQWNISTGAFVAGTDVTVKLSPQTFATANIGYLDGELIIQQKVIDRRQIGLALGGYYRAERRGFEITGDEKNLGLAGLVFGPIEDLIPDKHFYNQIIGGRASLYVPLNDNASYLHFTAAPGYAFNLSRALVNLSVGLQINF